MNSTICANCSTSRERGSYVDTADAIIGQHPTLGDEVYRLGDALTTL